MIDDRPAFLRKQTQRVEDHLGNELNADNGLDDNFCSQLEAIDELLILIQNIEAQADQSVIKSPTMADAVRVKAKAGDRKIEIADELKKREGRSPERAAPRIPYSGLFDFAGRKNSMSV